jgi:hypothetical protein
MQLESLTARRLDVHSSSRRDLALCLHNGDPLIREMLGRDEALGETRPF